MDSIVRVLANRSGCAILSLNYRRAPENKYPAALEDVYVALQWVLENAEFRGLDPNRIGVGGDSSGANLAAAATLMCRDRRGPRLSFQLLVYPVLAHDYENESYQRFGDGVLSALSRDDVAWFHQLYTNAPEELDFPYVSPLLTADLTGLPPALLVLAEIDPLFHEGMAYADRLLAAGIAVDRKIFPGMFHGFWWIAGVLEEARSALNEAATWLRAAGSEVGGCRRDCLPSDSPNPPISL